MKKFPVKFFATLKWLGFIKFIKTRLRSLGFSLVNSSSITSVHDFINMANSLQIPINVVYDIGANRGQWTRNLKDNCNKNISYYLFEPNVFHNQSLGATGSQYYNVLLSDSAEELDFYSINGTGDSIFKEVSEVYVGVKPIKMKTELLDHYVIRNHLPIPDLIKLDTQGSELKILKGALNLLGSVKFLIVECSILEYNSGAPTISEITKFLQCNGFQPYAVSEFHKNGKELFQIDVIFVAERVINFLA